MTAAAHACCRHGASVRTRVYSYLGPIPARPAEGGVNVKLKGP